MNIVKKLFSSLVILTMMLAMLPTSLTVKAEGETSTEYTYVKPEGVDKLRIVYHTNTSSTDARAIAIDYDLTTPYSSTSNYYRLPGRYYSDGDNWYVGNNGTTPKEYTFSNGEATLGTNHLVNNTYDSWQYGNRGSGFSRYIGYGWSTLKATNTANDFFRGMQIIDKNFVNSLEGYVVEEMDHETQTMVPTVHLYAQWFSLFSAFLNFGDFTFKPVIHTLNPDNGEYTEYTDPENPLYIDKSETLKFNADLTFSQDYRALKFLYGMIGEVTNWSGILTSKLDGRLIFDQNFRIRFSSTWLTIDEENADENHIVPGSISVEKENGIIRNSTVTFDFAALEKDGEGNYIINIPTKLDLSKIDNLTFDEFLEQMEYTVVDESGNPVSLSAYITDDSFNAISTSNNPVTKVGGNIALNLSAGNYGTRTYNSDADDQYIRLLPSGYANVLYVLDEDKTTEVRDSAVLKGRSVNESIPNVGAEENYSNTFSLYDLTASDDPTKDKTFNFEAEEGSSEYNVDVRSNRVLEKDGKKYVFVGIQVGSDDPIYLNDENGEQLIQDALQNQEFKYNEYDTDGTLTVDHSFNVKFLYQAASKPVTVKYEDVDGNSLADDMVAVSEDKPVNTTYDVTTEAYKPMTIEKDGVTYTYVEIKQGSATVTGVSSADEEKVITYVYKQVGAPVTVTYIDQNGDPASDPKVVVDGTKPVGTTYDVTNNTQFVPSYMTYNGVRYRFKRSTTQLSGTTTTTPTNIELVYDKLSAPVRVAFVDDQGNPIKPEEELLDNETLFGSPYDASTRKLTSFTTSNGMRYGYPTLSSTSPSETGTSGKDPIVVSYTYKLLSAPVTVKYVDENGTEIKDMVIVVNDQAVSGTDYDTTGARVETIQVGDKVYKLVGHVSTSAPEVSMSSYLPKTVVYEYRLMTKEPTKTVDTSDSGVLGYMGMALFAVLGMIVIVYRKKMNLQ